ncbi:MAG: HAMP domain-containing protein, partial [Nitrospirae bacterium]
MGLLKNRFSLSTKLIIVPLVFLVVVFLGSWALISQKVKKTIHDEENKHITTTVNALKDAFEKQIKTMVTTMKLTVVQDDLYDGFFGAIAEDYDFLKGFLRQTRVLAGVDEALVVDDTGKVLLRAVSDERADTFRYFDDLKEIFEKRTIKDRQTELDQTIKTFMKTEGNSAVVFTAGPVLDVETIVGAIVFVKEIDRSFLQALKSGYGQDIELSVATSEGIITATHRMDMKLMNLTPGRDIYHEINSRQYLTRFFPVGDGSILLGVCFDRTGTMMARKNLAIVMGAIFVIAIGVVGLINIFNGKRILSVLRGLKENAISISRGDLKEVPLIQGSDELAEMSQAFSRMVRSLRAMIEGLIRVSSSVSSTNSDIWSTLSVNLQGIENLSRQMEGVSSATDELSQTAIEITKNASKAAELAGAGTEEARKGMEKMEIAEQKIQDMAMATETLNNMILDLDSGIGNIGQVVDLINGIAEQTNLLALNAAIEAARAGEHGKGFSVVAEEIRKLAEKTMKATKDVSETIEMIKEKSSRTSEEVSRAEEKMKETVMILNEAGDMLRKIVEYSEISRDEAIKIAASVEQQSTTIEEIAQNIGNSAMITREAYEKFISLFERTDILSRSVEALEEQIKKFRFPIGHVIEIENAKISHKKWVQKLYRMYYRDEHIDIEEIKDHTQCAFGRWYRSLGKRDFGNLKEFVEIDSPHRLIHEEARAAVVAYQSGQKEEALQLIRQVEALSDEIVRRLDSLLSYLKKERPEKVLQPEETEDFEMSV